MTKGDDPHAEAGIRAENRRLDREDMGVQRPEEYALHFLREFTRMFPGQLVLLHKYARGENRL